MTNGSVHFDRPVFFTAYREHFGALSDHQKSGLERLLRFIEEDPAIADVRWAAYLLATVKWECAGTWQPIEEFGRGAGRAYGNVVTVRGADGQEYQNRYYGRGYVQLTWESNYRSMSRDLGLGEELWLNPERALDPEIAYRVISLGMTTGKSFANGHKFRDYESGKNSYNYTQARHMVNGADHAGDIAEIARHMEAILRAGDPLP